MKDDVDRGEQESSAGGRGFVRAALLDRDFAPGAAAMVLAAILYAPLLGTGFPSWWNGDWMMQLFRQEWVRKSVFEYGQFPMRCPFVGGGYPILGDPEDTALNPLTWCLLPFPSDAALKLRFYLAAIAAAGGAYLLSRSAMKMTRWGSFYAALLFSTAPWMAWQVRGGSCDEFYPALIPLCLFFLLTAARRPWRLAASVLLLYAALSDGNPAIIPAAMFLILVFGVWRLEGAMTRWTPLAFLGAALLLTALIGAMRILPAMEVLAERGAVLRPSVRGHAELVAGATYTWDRYVRNLLGLHGRDWWGDLFYVGFAPTALFLAGFCLAWRKVLAWAVVSFLFVWLLLGENAFFDLRALLVKLPFCNVLDRPAKYVHPYVVLSVAMGGAACLDAMMRIRKAWLRHALAAACACAAILPLAPVVLELTTVALDQPAPAPTVDAAREFYNVAESPGARGESPKEALCYFNLLRHVGTIDWQTAAALPTTAQPRFFVDSVGRSIPNPQYRGEVHLERGLGAASARIEPTRIVVEADLQGPDVVVINQNFDKGWRTDGGSLEQRDGLLAIRLDRPGRHSITLRYFSGVFRAGLAITAVGLAMLAAFCVVWRRRAAVSDGRADVAGPLSWPAAGPLRPWPAALALCLVLAAAWPVARIGPTGRAAITLAEQGEDFVKAGRTELAKGLYQQALAADPWNCQALVRLAEYAVHDDDLRAAIQYDSTYLELAPRDPNARWRRAEAYADLEDYERAAADYSTLLEMGARSFDAHLGRGKAYLTMEQYERALADFHAAVSVNPDSALAHYWRGYAFAAIGSDESARQDWRRAAALDPDGPVGRQARRLLEGSAESDAEGTEG